MKSISDLTPAIIQAAQENQNQIAPITTAPRLSPLESADIEKIEAVIVQHFTVRREPIYGTKTTRDQHGEIVSQEFDLLGYRETMTPHAGTEVPHRLREALLRPATTRHVVFHLTRLAAHRRDTRGPAGLAAALTDIALDLGSVSEWAVVCACRDFRLRATAGKNWYPETGEIINAISAQDAMLRRLLEPKAAEAQKITAQPMPKTWNELPKPQWGVQHWADYAANALRMAEMAKQNPSMFDPEFWVIETARRRNEAALAGFVPEEVE